MAHGPRFPYIALVAARDPATWGPGPALGNFLARFIHEGFMGESPHAGEVGATAYLDPTGPDACLVLHGRF